MYKSPEHQKKCMIWSNCDKMFELMQEIKRPREIDHASFDFKMNFWKEKVLNHLSSEKIAIFNEEFLVNTFSRYFPREGTRISPECMFQVINFLFSQKVFDYPVVDLNIVQKFIYFSLYASVSIPSKIISYVWQNSSNSSLKTRSYGDNKTAITFPKLVDQLCDNFIAYFQEVSSKNILIQHPTFYSLEDFEKCLKIYFSHAATREYIKFVLNHRNLTQQHISKTQPSNKAIRISKDSHTPLLSLTENEIKQIDCMLDLKEKIKSLENRQEILSQEIDRIKKKTIDLRDAGNKTAALNMLRRLKIYEKKLNETMNVILKLDETWLQVEAASDNEKILNVLDQVQKAIAITTGGYKGVEKAQSVVESLAQVTDETNEMSEIITNQNIAENKALNESAELELEALLRDDKKLNIDQALSSLGQLKIGDLPKLVEEIDNPIHTDIYPENIAF